jgi:hypothetical protein
VPHPDHLEQLLTPRQVREWALFWEVEPFGTPADDLRSAQIAWAAMTGPAAKPKKWTIDEFVPRWGPVDPLSPAELREKMRAVLARSAPRA